MRGDAFDSAFWPILWASTGVGVLLLAWRATRFFGIGVYLPRSLDFRTLTQADLDAIADRLNGRRPRPSLAKHQPWGQ